MSWKNDRGWGFGDRVKCFTICVWRELDWMLTEAFGMGGQWKLIVISNECNLSAYAVKKKRVTLRCWLDLKILLQWTGCWGVYTLRRNPRCFTYYYTVHLYTRTSTTSNFSYSPQPMNQKQLLFFTVRFAFDPTESSSWIWLKFMGLRFELNSIDLCFHYHSHQIYVTSCKKLCSSQIYHLWLNDLHMRNKIILKCRTIILFVDFCSYLQCCCIRCVSWL